METTVKQAESTNLYQDMLILRLKDLSDVYSLLLTQYAKITRDEDLFNAFLSELIVISNHLIAKLEGGGSENQDLLKQFNEYEEWFENIAKPKLDIKEQERVHKLFRLILKAYDSLNISNY